jgi:hypothetical protein
MRRIVAPSLASILALGLAVGAASLATACRGDVQQCEQACRNFGNLVEWKPAEVELAAAPADQRDALRKRKAGELDRHVDVCVSKCVSGNNSESVACLIAAKTADQALACAR